MSSFGLRHLGLKFLSIALAALLWLLVSGERIVERAMRIPLEFTNLPAQLEVVGDAPNVVDVRLRGSSGALSRVTTVTASSECPPSSKKLSRRPTRGTASTSAQIAAMCSSIGVLGDSYWAAPAHSGPSYSCGSNRRLSFPLGVRGSSVTGW